MSDHESELASAPRSPDDSSLFATESRIAGAGASGGKAGRNRLPWIVAGVAILLSGGAALLLGTHHAPVGSSAGGYATQLVFSNVRLSQTSNFAGDQLTYVDGTLSNRGNRTVTAVTVRVLFASSTGDPPQAEQVALHLIRRRQPFVETEPVSAAPLTPGSAHHFRLTFDHISPAWNRHIPALTIENLSFLH